MAILKCLKLLLMEIAMLPFSFFIWTHLCAVYRVHNKDTQHSRKNVASVWATMGWTSVELQWTTRRNVPIDRTLLPKLVFCHHYTFVRNRRYCVEIYKKKTKTKGQTHSFLHIYIKKFPYVSLCLKMGRNMRVACAMYCPRSIYTDYSGCYRELFHTDRNIPTCTISKKCVHWTSMPF
jgi:hypothetical protein